MAFAMLWVPKTLVAALVLKGYCMRKEVALFQYQLFLGSHN